MKIMRYSFIFSILMLISIQQEFKINSSANSEIISKMAEKLIGLDSKLYPKNSLLMMMLYGHSDVRFNLTNLINSYRFKINDSEKGALIIQNDGLFSGICLDEYYFVYVNRASTVEKHSLEDIYKIFNSSFTLLSTQFLLYSSPIIISTKTLNNIDFCPNCDTYFLFDEDSNLFDINQFWKIYLFSRTTKSSYTLTGYLKSFDHNYQRGQISLFFYYFFDATSQNEYSGFFNNGDNLMNFTTSDKMMNFKIYSQVQLSSPVTLSIQGSWGLI